MDTGLSDQKAWKVSWSDQLKPTLSRHSQHGFPKDCQRERSQAEVQAECWPNTENASQKISYFLQW